MSYPLHPSQLAHLHKLPAKKREAYFLEKVREHGQVWSLKSDDGWVSMVFDEQDCFPVWPHPDLAKVWAKGDWADCDPVAISLTDFIDKWLPGMENDELALAIFIAEDGTAAVNTAEKLRAALTA